jgi:tripeptide aminopeptidase
VRRATEGERERLHETFTSLCRIESPSGRERACADWVTAELRGLGLEVEEDDAGRRAGSDAGNLLARIPGRDAESVLLCGHLDTVPPTAPIEPVVVNGGFENSGDGILGADNKAMVAVMVELARRLTAAGEQPPVGVELLFTVSEEVGLLGAQEFDVSRLKSSFGFLFDNASPLGEVVVASPTYYRVVAELHGRAAHAGIRPEDGRSAIAAAARGIAAMRLGRLDPETTSNVGTISGGTNVNVIPERCRLVAEARSLDTDRAEAVATEMVDHLQDAANEYECDLDVTVERVFKGYRTRTRAREVLVAEHALLACGYEPRQIATGGASDANALQAAGFACATLADGTVHNHEPGERISIDVLDGLLDVALALVEEAGRGEGAAPS